MILSIDDGAASDERIAKLCDKFGIEAIFYWPSEWHSLAFYKGYSPLAYEAARQIATRYEVGSHTISHRHLTDLPIDDAKREIADSKDLLENLFGTEIRKFAPPRGYINQELTEFALEIYESVRLTKGQGLVHIHPNSGANGNIPWRDYYHKIKDSEENIELWGHSHEWDRFQMWGEIEEFFETIYR